MSTTQDTKYLASKYFDPRAINFIFLFEIKRGRLCGKWKMLTSV